MAATTTSARSTTTAAPRTQPPQPAYTEADYAEIVAAVRDYAESKALVRFTWNPALTYEYARSGRAGYHDVVNISQSSSTAYVISRLKYHVDLTETHGAGGSGGVPGYAAHYNIEVFEYQNDVMAVFIYS